MSDERTTEHRSTEPSDDVPTHLRDLLVLPAGSHGTVLDRDELDRARTAPKTA